MGDIFECCRGAIVWVSDEVWTDKHSPNEGVKTFEETLEYLQRDGRLFEDK